MLSIHGPDTYIHTHTHTHIYIYIWGRGNHGSIVVGQEDGAPVILILRQSIWNATTVSLVFLAFNGLSSASGGLSAVGFHPGNCLPFRVGK